MGIKTEKTTTCKNVIREYVLRKPVKAVQWFKNGDHPNDRVTIINENGEYSEGNAVRRFRSPDVSGKTWCSKCGDTMHHHGWIDHGSQYGQTVCPSDYILETPEGDYYRMSKQMFEDNYKLASSGEEKAEL